VSCHFVSFIYANITKRSPGRYDNKTMIDYLSVRYRIFAVYCPPSSCVRNINQPSECMSELITCHMVLTLYSAISIVQTSTGSPCRARLILVVTCSMTLSSVLVIRSVYHHYQAVKHLRSSDSHHHHHRVARPSMSVAVSSS